jgi:hypothetical protein
MCSVQPDHSAVNLKIQSCQIQKQGPSHWKFNTSLINNQEYASQLESLIKSCATLIENKDNPCSLWEFIKFKIREFSITFSKDLSAKRRSQRGILEKEFKIADNLYCENPTKDNEKVLLDIKSKLEDYNRYETDGAILRSKCNWYENGEKCSKYFLNLEKQNKNKSNVKKLLVDGVETTDRQEILSKIKEFYHDKYELNDNINSVDCNSFLKDLELPTISEGDVKLCEEPITKTEIYNVIKSMKNNKSPGNDGLSKEFYISYFHLIGDILLKCFNYCFEQGELTTTQRQAIITLVEKPGKDVRLLKSWRPISLLNVDAKILSSVLANRIKLLLPNLIPESQSAFIANRNISDPIRTISDVIHYSDQTKDNYMLFAADFAAAFDSIRHSFMFEVLKKFGFPNKFTRWIEIIHSNIESCVVNEGFSTGYFKLKRGTRQGDPLAPYLFILVIEVLGIMVKKNKSIKGIILGDNEIKYCMFADDSTFFLKDSKSFKELRNTLHIFSIYSLLIVNYDKSELAFLGTKPVTTDIHSECKIVDIHKDSIKILGIYFSMSNTLMEKLNFDRVFESFKTTLNMWKSRSLTLFGKNEVMKSLAFSKILYVTSLLIPPQKFLEKVKAEILKFIWSGRIPKVAYKVLISGKENGGIGLPDIYQRIKTQQIIFVKRLLSDSLPPWKFIPLLYLNTIGGLENIRSNFDKANIPRKLPKYYRVCLEEFACFTNKIPNSKQEVLLQPVWNNAKIKQGKKSFYIKELDKVGVKSIDHIWCTRTKQIKPLKCFFSINSAVYAKHFMSWCALIKSIPVLWLNILKQDNSHLNTNLTMSNSICSADGIYQIEYLTSKKIYSIYVSDNVIESKGNVKFVDLLQNEFEWNDACNLIYLVSIDSYTRYFQYKILQNYLSVNFKLKKWKILDSDRCSYCFVSQETVEHLFVHCPSAVTLYSQIKEWCVGLDIHLPKLETKNIVYGILPCTPGNYLINLFIILYKQMLFNGRQNSKGVTLDAYKNKVTSVHNIEYNIALNKNKLAKHLQKWKNISLNT